MVQDILLLLFNKACHSIERYVVIMKENRV